MFHNFLPYLGLGVFFLYHCSQHYEGTFAFSDVAGKLIVSVSVMFSA